jgi:hypothetical protein
MSDVILAVTDAARNFTDGVSRAHHQQQAFPLVKNGIPFARIVPAGKPFCRGRELAEALSRVELSVAQARAWLRELKMSRKMLKPPVDRRQ